ncbi:MAG: TonB-dependent receptor [Hydrocarboniphaga sp.]|uniref:TonB-dependent receptor n=1 Tax=Hydrocarboniphaga sp. TaxID=2033016 RepID=UPI002625F2F0|nr:TonB-dependent receptor [Hydrocarboniphaga sp.]MDB5972177.1 TonB-dependent receptor [Hydrocarboniphaga sp.]
MFKGMTLGFTVAVVVTSTFAAAQEPTPEAPQADPASPASAPNEIEEVIVSARKRQESILKVPVVESALTEQQLDQFATADLNAISDQIPGLLIGAATASFGAQISLRGVGTSTLNSTIDQSVSLNIDGMQMTQGLAYKAGMFDMAQVEVLKGPQALFYGKSSPGGVIAIHTADPGSEFELVTRGGYEFESAERKGELIVSGPVNDTLGLRLATAVSSSDGFFRNEASTPPGYGGVDPKYRDFAPDKEWQTRGTAVWKPSAEFNARLKANFAHTRIDGDGGGLQYKSCPDGTDPIPALGNIPFLAGEDCHFDRRLRLVDMDLSAFPGLRNGGVPFSNINQGFGTVELNYELPSHLQLSSVSGYYSTRQGVEINGSLAASAGPTLVTDTDFSRHDFTQELRLASDFVSPVNFTLGAFYQDGFMKNTNNLRGNTALGLPSLLQQGYHDIDITSYSGFGQARWSATRQLELAAGARWTQEERTHTQINTISGTPVETTLADPKIKSDNISPEVTVTYTPTDNLTVFGSYKQAYKSGSFDTVTIAAENGEAAFGDEKVEGFEAGIKSRFLDRRLSFNVAGYRYRYRDMQVGANEVTPDGLVIDRTLNAASSTIYGVDLDLAYRPEILRGLTARGGLNWNHARYDQFDDALCWGGQTAAEGCNRIPDATQTDPNTGEPLFTAQDLSGHRLVRAPAVSATFGFDYQAQVGHDMTAGIASSTLYSSKYLTNLTDRSDMVQDSYFKTNLSLSLSGHDDRWELALIGNNLNNAITTGNCVNAPLASGIAFGGEITGGTSSGPAGVDELACNAEPGRELWVRLTLRPVGLF